jgi:hypothetical protein
MSWRFVCVFAAIALPAPAQTRMSVDEVVRFIKSSIKLRQEDRLVADYVQHKIKLTEKLEDRTVEDLQGMGAGPKTVAALHKLGELSASLPVAPPPQAPAPPPPPIPPPNSEEQKAILAEIRENALNYTNGLPNYICTQVTRRHADPTGTGDHWRLADTVQEQLSFFDHKESYKVTMVSGQMVTNVSHEQVGGVTSSGEFGSMLYEIFDPATETEFEWDHWATLRKHRMFVYAFHVSHARSKYRIYHGGSHRTITAAYKGLVYADRDTKMVMRIKMECEDIPADFPVQQIALDLNYDFTKISDQSFLLPLKSELISRDGAYMSRNETEYRLYRKYAADAVISFETPDAIPDDKTKEEKPPVKKQ